MNMIYVPDCQTFDDLLQHSRKNADQTMSDYLSADFFYTQLQYLLEYNYHYELPFAPIDC